MASFRSGLKILCEISKRQAAHRSVSEDRAVKWKPSDQWVVRDSTNTCTQGPKSVSRSWTSLFREETKLDCNPKLNNCPAPKDEECWYQSFLKPKSSPPPQKPSLASCREFSCVDELPCWALPYQPPPLAKTDILPAQALPFTLPKALMLRDPCACVGFPPAVPDTVDVSLPYDEMRPPRVWKKPSEFSPISSKSTAPSATSFNKVRGRAAYFEFKTVDVPRPLYTRYKTVDLSDTGNFAPKQLPCPRDATMSSSTPSLALQPLPLNLEKETETQARSSVRTKPGQLKNANVPEPFRPKPTKLVEKTKWSNPCLDHKMGNHKLFKTTSPKTGYPRPSSDNKTRPASRVLTATLTDEPPSYQQFQPSEKPPEWMFRLSKPGKNETPLVPCSDVPKEPDWCGETDGLRFYDGNDEGIKPKPGPDPCRTTANEGGPKNVPAPEKKTRPVRKERYVLMPEKYKVEFARPPPTGMDESFEAFVASQKQQLQLCSAWPLAKDRILYESEQGCSLTAATHPSHMPCASTPPPKSCQLPKRGFSTLSRCSSSEAIPNTRCKSSNCDWKKPSEKNLGPCKNVPMNRICKQQKCIPPKMRDCAESKMPCCPPARVPPNCSLEQVSRKPCCKILAPKPSFSECRKMELRSKRITECDCWDKNDCQLIPESKTSTCKKSFSDWAPARGYISTESLKVVRPAFSDVMREYFTPTRSFSTRFCSTNKISDGCEKKKKKKEEDCTINFKIPPEKLDCPKPPEPEKPCIPCEKVNPTVLPGCQDPCKEPKIIEKKKKCNSTQPAAGIKVLQCTSDPRVIAVRTACGAAKNTSSRAVRSPPEASCSDPCADAPNLTATFPYLQPANSSVHVSSFNIAPPGVPQKVDSSAKDACESNLASCGLAVQCTRSKNVQPCLPKIPPKPKLCEEPESPPQKKCPPPKKSKPKNKCEPSCEKVKGCASSTKCSKEPVKVGAVSNDVDSSKGLISCFKAWLNGGRRSYTTVRYRVREASNDSGSKKPKLKTIPSELVCSMGVGKTLQDLPCQKMQSDDCAEDAAPPTTSAGRAPPPYRRVIAQTKKKGADQCDPPCETSLLEVPQSCPDPPKPCPKKCTFDPKCYKVCMPCCPPARCPAKDCVVKDRRPCKRTPPPRPSFSECDFEIPRVKCSEYYIQEMNKKIKIDPRPPPMPFMEKMLSSNKQQEAPQSNETPCKKVVERPESESSTVKQNDKCILKPTSAAGLGRTLPAHLLRNPVTRIPASVCLLSTKASSRRTPSTSHFIMSKKEFEEDRGLIGFIKLRPKESLSVTWEERDLKGNARVEKSPSRLQSPTANTTKQQTSSSATEITPESTYSVTESEEKKEDMFLAVKGVKINAPNPKEDTDKRVRRISESLELRQQVSDAFKAHTAREVGKAKRKMLADIAAVLADHNGSTQSGLILSMNGSGQCGKSSDHCQQQQQQQQQQQKKKNLCNVKEEKKKSDDCTDWYKKTASKPGPVCGKDDDCVSKCAQEK